MSSTIPELTSCRICPRFCNINRYQEIGYCQASANIEVNLHQLHFGEEPVLSGTNGSGTIFFSNCNLRCVFCQNHNISDSGWGNEISIDNCMQMMLELQNKGAHNINLVTPSHYSLQLAQVIKLAKEKGLVIPIVWNSNAYENVETIRYLEGLIDVYLPDLKYSDCLNSAKYSNAADYTLRARQVISEMNRQVGQLYSDEHDIAQRGLIIRMLVMPNNVAGITENLLWISENLGKETYISVMAQYYPTHQAHEFAEINRGITQSEYDEVLQTIETLGFENGFIQELSCSNEWTPDFVMHD